MPVSAEEYKQLKALLNDPEWRKAHAGNDSLDARDAVVEYEMAFMSKTAAPEIEQMRREEEQAAAPAELSMSARPQFEEPAPEPELSMSPSFSLLPQALSVQPATTHPGGDEAAANEWISNPAEAPKGKVFVYDVPLDTAKKDVLENPQKLRVLYPNLFAENPAYLTPEEIINSDHSAEWYQDYNNHTWRDTAAAAAGAGKTAIRYSKAPWLHLGGGGPGALEALGIKLEGAVQPYGEISQAFVMGVDDTASFGALAGGQEALGLQGEPLNPLGTERVGGVTETDAKERNAQLRQEHPVAEFGGQALGMLAPWGPANRLFGEIMRGGRAAASALGGGLAARAATGTAAGAVGVGAMQAGQDLVDVGAGAARGDESALGLGDIPGRAGDAALLGLPLAALGGVVGEGALRQAGGPRGDRTRGGLTGTSGGVRWGNRYDGAVGNLEADLGGDFRVGVIGGPKSKSIEKLKIGARSADKQPGDMLASEIAQPIANVLREDTRAALGQVGERRDAFLKSDEGRKLIPVRNFLEQTVTELRSDMQAAGKEGVPKAVGRAGSSKELLDFFSQQVDTVSLAPREGAIALSPEEAQAFLGRDHQKALLKEKPGKAPTGGPRQPFERARDAGPAIEAQRTVSVRGEPSPPPLIEPPVPPRPSAGINASEPRQTPEAPAARLAPPPEAALSAGKAPADSAAGAKTRRESLPRGKSLADTLRKRGVERVYVTPRAYDAEHTETLLDKINALKQESKRDLSKLDQAARRDRDARSLGGEAGGWSRLQNAHSELIEKSKLAEELGAPGGSAFKVITGYGKQKSGELPRVDVLRDAAERAGVREQLNRVRSLERYEGLRRQTKLERATPGSPERGVLTRGLDMASVRTLPLLDVLSGMGPSLGRAQQFLPDEAEKERRKKKLEESPR